MNSTKFQIKLLFEKQTYGIKELFAYFLSFSFFFYPQTEYIIFNKNPELIPSSTRYLSKEINLVLLLLNNFSNYLI